MFGDGIFTQEGEAWKQSRDFLRPQLTHRQYEDLGVFQDPMHDLLSALPHAGGIVHLQPLFFRFTLDVTTAFLFGDSVRCLVSTDNSEEQEFAASFDLAQKYVMNRFRLLDLYWLIGGSRFRRACNTVHTFADRIIDRNLGVASQEDHSHGRCVFLKSIAKACPDRISLRGQIINLLAAGRDSTASLLSWVL